jgi:hypothetical protein
MLMQKQLRANAKTTETMKGKKLCLLANINPIYLSICTTELDAAETLVIVISKKPSLLQRTYWTLALPKSGLWMVLLLRE